MSRVKNPFSRLITPVKPICKAIYGGYYSIHNWFDWQTLIFRFSMKLTTHTHTHQEMRPYISLQVQDCKNICPLDLLFENPYRNNGRYGKTLNITVDFESQGNYANNYVGIIKNNLYQDPEKIY